MKFISSHNVSQVSVPKLMCETSVAIVLSRVVMNNGQSKELFYLRQDGGMLLT